MLEPGRVERARTAQVPVWILWLMILVGPIGCDRTAELANQQRDAARVGKLVTTTAGNADRTAVGWLEKCAAAYARVTSYQDAGRVVMSYQVDGQPTQDVAPLAVAYESPNRLGMKAYQVLAGPSSNRWRLRVESRSNDSPLSRQVLSRELPKQLSLAWLAADPIAVEHWAAGLAGSPPQLELLLGDQPFRALLDGATQVAMDGQGTDGGQTCHIIKIMRGESRYRLWIGAANALLRRIELPTTGLPAAMLSDSHITDIRLSIELDDPQIGTRLDWSKWEVPASPLDQLVRYFVAPPITLIDPRLGKPVPAFRLPACVTNDVDLDTSAVAGVGKVQVLLWLADHPSCQAALDQLHTALARVPEPLRERIAPAIVWAEADPPEGMTFPLLKKQWHIDMPLVRDNGEVGRDVLGIVEAPAMLVLDGKHRLQLCQQRGNPTLSDILPDMLMRLINGENLGQAAQAQLQLQQERFISSLWDARASDCPAGALTKPSQTAPGHWQLTAMETIAIKPSILALHSDTQHNLWLLQGDGKLQQLSPTGKPERQLDTGLGLKALPLQSTSTLRMAVDDAARFVAICSAARDALHVQDLNTSQSSAIELGQQTLSDFRWLDTPVGLRLAAVSQSGKTLLIDPSRFEQHSGHSNSPPLAVLPRVAEEALTSGYVVLSDGRIEPLIVHDEGGAKAAALSRPAWNNAANNSAKSGPTQALTVSSQDKLPTLAGGPPPGGVLKQLQFSPGRGPWTQWRDPKHTLTLATGWLASDEPAVFVLDDRLQQLWHAPLPIQEGAEIVGASVATDPATGQAVWVIATHDSTIHFFRADGQLVDNWKTKSAVRGVAVVPMGQEHRLWVAEDKQLIQYRMATR